MTLRSLGFVLALIGCSLAIAEDIPLPKRETRAVWVATVGNIDWPSRKNLSTDKQKAEAEAILDRAVRLNMNMVILQVRPACDAIYPSKFAPWSPYLCGSMGQCPEPQYDPLQFWIEEAHRRGLELHAWFNPYRALTSTSVQASDDHVSLARPELVKPYGEQMWLDPGMPEVQQMLLNSIIEVVDNYDVDGIHFDDYFYPYPISGQAFADAKSYDDYLTTGGGMSLGDWRRSNVDGMVSDVYTAIKERKPWVKFGISPFGIWRPNHPSGITGLDAYNELDADSRKWLQEGWVDYMSPQLYWSTTSTKQNYGSLLKWWSQQNVLGRHIWPGNYTSKLNQGWPAQEILNQIGATRANAGSTGNIHFSAKALMANYKGIATALRNGPYGSSVLVPPSPWLDDTAPPIPATPSLSRDANALHLTLNTESTEPVRFYIVATQYGAAWSYRFTSPDKPEMDLLSSTKQGALERVAIAAIDRVENVSDWNEVAFKSRAKTPQ